MPDAPFELLIALFRLNHRPSLRTIALLALGISTAIGSFSITHRLLAPHLPSPHPLHFILCVTVAVITTPSLLLLADTYLKKLPID